jgi:glycosyltransferase involved in cell wall biosynthesis
MIEESRHINLRSASGASGMAPDACRSGLRILFLINELRKGGAERFLIDLCTALQNRPDVEFVIGTLFDSNEYTELTARLPIVQLHYVPFSFTAAREYATYQSLLQEFKPDIVHTHLYLAEFLSAQHVSKDITYVCHGHDNMVQFAKLGVGTLLDRVAVTNWLEKRYIIRNKYRQVATSFVANSPHTLAYYKAVLPRFMRGDIHLLRYGFDYERFRARELPTLPASGPVRLINVGSFQHKKNQIFIVSVAKALREAGIDFHVDLLGDGENRARVQAEVHRSGLGDRITLHGNVDRVEEWLWRSHLYLHTAWYEPFGLVLLEAMAAGLPCVVLDGKGNRDLIEQGQNGYMIDEQSPSEFVARIQAMATSPEAYGAMSAYAREYAKGFDIGRAADRFVAFYHQCRLQARGRA